MEIPTDFHLALGAGLHEVLAKAQHALLVGIEPLTRKSAPSSVIPGTHKLITIKEALCLRIPKKSNKILNI